MNNREKDLLKLLYDKQYGNQRLLSEESGYSLGIVNRSIKNLKLEGFLDENMQITLKAINEMHKNKVKNAIILAAGYGMRMVPINTEIPKGLLEIKGEVLIERMIEQLHEAGVYNIYIIVGFMKERYEYLIDKYQVHLIVNPEYSRKNNMHSLKRAVRYLSNSYIIPCDIWCKENPFHSYEMYSWYMVSDEMDLDSDVRVNRKQELVSVSKLKPGNKMIGISYLDKSDAQIIKEILERRCQNSIYDQDFWEETLYKEDRMLIQARMISKDKIFEINTFEQLREIDNHSNQLQSDILDLIADVLKTETKKITNIEVLKKGMTNRSFIFSCEGKRYIMRIPGEGTELLINRMEEAEVYHVIKDKNMCDDIVYMNPENGYKITKFLENAKVCDPFDWEEVEKCMKQLRHFHDLKLKMGHEFDLFKHIDFYESLWNENTSMYCDYQKTKRNVLLLKPYIESCKSEWGLTHIDAVPDNFLLIPDKSGKMDIRLIDWEYAGMQDPHVDIAMFCIYSLYDKERVDYLIDLYFEGDCSEEIRIKIYCYIAVCGLLWSNWCEYKYQLGIEFGEYSLCQYRYAKDYYRYAVEAMKDLDIGRGDSYESGN